MIKKFDILVKRLTKSKFAGILGYCMWDKKNWFSSRKTHQIKN